MAKKDFRGLSSLMTGIGTQTEETNAETPVFLTTGAKKQSGNTKMKGEKGYYRKTFLMDAELGAAVEAWAWYSRTKEKEIAEQALREFLSKIDQKELGKAVLGFNKNH